MAVLHRTSLPKTGGEDGVEKPAAKGGDERRRHQRIVVNRPCRYVLEDGSEHKGVCVDVSAGGIRLSGAQMGAWGSRVVAHVEGYGRIEGQIVRRGPGWFGVQTRLSYPLLKLSLGGLSSLGLAGLTSSVGGLALLTCVGAALIGYSVYRYEFAVGHGSGLAGVATPVVGSAKEAVFTARPDGRFIVPARINDKTIELLFDAAAPSVILTAEDAAAAGLSPGPKDFQTSLAVANGKTTAAPARLGTVTVGEIVVGEVGALVARPGALRQSLLGKSLLDRLRGYSVDGGKLVLTGK